MQFVARGGNDGEDDEPDETLLFFVFFFDSFKRVVNSKSALRVVYSLAWCKMEGVHSFPRSPLFFFLI